GRFLGAHPSPGAAVPTPVQTGPPPFVPKPAAPTALAPPPQVKPGGAPVPIGASPAAPLTAPAPVVATRPAEPLLRPAATPFTVSANTGSSFGTAPPALAATPVTGPAALPPLVGGLLNGGLVLG